jgi:hypothetical protein
VCFGKLSGENDFFYPVSGKWPRGESSVSTPSAIFGEAFMAALREAVQVEIHAAGNDRRDSGPSYARTTRREAQTPLSVGPMSRAVKKRIPTDRLGRYIRFDLWEVVESQQKKNQQ